MTMTFDEYMDQITLGIIPEQPQNPPYLTGGISGHPLFKLRTFGMDEFGRPDLEMINVPALFVHAAGKIINHWAHYSINDTEIKVDETLVVDHGLPCLLRAVKTDEPNVLRLVVESVQFECCKCGNGGTCDGGDNHDPTIH